MITREEARHLVVLDLERKYGRRDGPSELVILDEQTIERQWGWIFFYNSRGWRDGDTNYALGGNAPYLVERHDGSIRVTGTAFPIEHYIRAYEDELERRSGAWELYVCEQPDCPPQVASAIRTALGLSVAELGAFKKRLPAVWSAGARVDLEPYYQRLTAAGVRAELKLSARRAIRDVDW